MLKKKAQAATEYLSTYGWAVLILALVLAALWGMGVFDVKAPETCNFPGGTFACGNYKLVRESTNVAFRYFELTNNLNNNVYICGFVCSRQAPDTSTGVPSGLPFSNPFVASKLTMACAPGSKDPSPIDMTLGSGETKKIVWGTVPEGVFRVVFKCVDANGEYDTANVGDAYSSNLYVFYSFDGDTAGAARIAVGHFSTTVQKWNPGEGSG